MQKKKKQPSGTLAVNRKARHDYDVLETYEAGISLAGTEAKSIRNGGANLKDAWCQAGPNGLVLRNMHVSPYSHGGLFNPDPIRERALLMHKRAIRKLAAPQRQDGLTLFPLDLHLSHGLVKLTLGVCKGRKNYDKREAVAKRDAQRDMARAFRDHH